MQGGFLKQNRLFKKTVNKFMNSFENNLIDMLLRKVSRNKSGYNQKLNSLGN